MSQKIKKAIFPVAGMGTRFLPATKATPKEMLPIVDKPLIQYAVEEAMAAGITELVFVTSGSKRAIENHFDRNYELENQLRKQEKYDLLEIVKAVVPKGISYIYVRQPQALGLGHAVLCARPVVANEPFAVILADDLIDGGAQGGCLSQMVELFDAQGCSLLGVEEVDPAETNQYGIVGHEPVSDRLSRVQDIVEKPAPEAAPSTLAVVGRYILTPRIFDYLEKLGRGAGGEIQLTDAIAGLLREEQILAYEFDGTRYDCGSKLGYLKATVEFALKHAELQDPFREYLQRFCFTR
ncbi:MAG: UTP--glucose-1-phosphate uridylyltransferase GalU [Gammaproteobacteria bacterium]